MAPVVEVITERVELGEGPHWDIEKQCLYFVDILGQTILKYVPSTGKTTQAVLGLSIFFFKFENSQSKFKFCNYVFAIFVVLLCFRRGTGITYCAS